MCIRDSPGTRATLSGFHMSASKARVVLNLIRGEDIKTASDILSGTAREAAGVILKVLNSAVANAVNNDGLVAEELYVSAAYADEGVTMKRFTPRARGRAGAIRKRSCHITVIVSRMDEDRLELLRIARAASATASRARRVASSRRKDDPVPAPQYEVANENVDVVAEETTDVTAVETEVVADDVVETTDAADDAVVAETTPEETSDETTEETN